MRRLIISASIGGLVLAGAYMAPSANAATCPAQYSNNAQHTAVGPTPVYTSGAGGAPTLPPSTQNGYVGASGSQGGAGGYVEANGGSSATPVGPGGTGYVVVSGSAAGQSGGVVIGPGVPTPAQCS